MATTAFSIHDEPRLFLGAMLFYTCADAVAIGLDPTVTTATRSETGDRWVLPPVPDTYDITLTDWTAQSPPAHYPTVELPDPDHPGSRVRFLLHPKPEFVANAVIARGTACYAARPFPAENDKWDYVCKSQWRDEARMREGDILFEAKFVPDRRRGCVKLIVMNESNMLDPAETMELRKLKMRLEQSKAAFSAAAVATPAVDEGRQWLSRSLPIYGAILAALDEAIAAFSQLSPTGRIMDSFDW